MDKQSCFSIYNHISLASVLTTRLGSFLNTYTGQPDFFHPLLHTLHSQGIMCSRSMEAELWLSFAEILQKCIADVSRCNPVYQSRSCMHSALLESSHLATMVLQAQFYLKNYSQKKFHNQSLVRTLSG